MSEERKLGLGTFSTFRFTNKSSDRKGQQAGVVPTSGTNDCGYEAKKDGNAAIMNDETGDAAIPAGMAAPTVLYVWGVEEGDGDSWHRYELTFDVPVTTLEVTSNGAASMWADPGMLDVGATGENLGQPPRLQGQPVSSSNGSNPTWC